MQMQVMNWYACSFREVLEEYRATISLHALRKKHDDAITHTLADRERFLRGVLLSKQRYVLPPAVAGDFAIVTQDLCRPRIDVPDRALRIGSVFRIQQILFEDLHGGPDYTWLVSLVGVEFNKSPLLYDMRSFRRTSVEATAERNDQAISA